MGLLILLASGWKLHFMFSIDCILGLATKSTNETGVLEKPLWLRNTAILAQNL